MLRNSATCVIHVSATNIPCGAPKPRNAVFEATLVRQTLPTKFTLGILNIMVALVTGIHVQQLKMYNNAKFSVT